MPKRLIAPACSHCWTTLRADSCEHGTTQEDADVARTTALLRNLMEDPEGRSVLLLFAEQVFDVITSKEQIADLKERVKTLEVERERDESYRQDRADWR